VIDASMYLRYHAAPGGGTHWLGGSANCVAASSESLGKRVSLVIQSLRTVLKELRRSMIVAEAIDSGLQD
jgi:hypothetical protein